MSKRIQFPQAIVERAKELGKARFAFGIVNRRISGEIFSFIDEENSDKLLIFIRELAEQKTPVEAFKEAWNPIVESPAIR